MPWTCSYCPIFCCEANEARDPVDFDKAYLVAQFQGGGNKVTGDPKADPEYELIKGKEPRGELVWDPCHTRPTSRFSTVARVALRGHPRRGAFLGRHLSVHHSAGYRQGRQVPLHQRDLGLPVVDAKRPQRWSSGTASTSS